MTHSFHVQFNLLHLEDQYNLANFDQSFRNIAFYIIDLNTLMGLKDFETLKELQKHHRKIDREDKYCDEIDFSPLNLPNETCINDTLYGKEDII